MLLRIVGVLMLGGFLFGLAIFVLGLKKKPELIREIGLESLLTSGGLLSVGFGLAFSSGLGRILLLGGGIAAYLYGLALGYTKKHEKVEL